jgi:hypothetical protein
LNQVQVSSEVTADAIAALISSSQIESHAKKKGRAIILRDPAGLKHQAKLRT